MNYFITAIGTESGKTLVSAIFCRALCAEYWKPIQAGYPTDSETINELLPGVKIHKEACLLKAPESPHAAAKKEDKFISLEDILTPKHNGDLIIEGAGGLMVPLNEEELMIDLIEKLKVEVILVSNIYLGSINHSLLSIEALKNRNIKIAGVVFNGGSNVDSERVILKYAKAPCLLRIKEESKINEAIVNRYAKELLRNLNS